MRRGFTLVELLVVIGIIAILAAILFPVFTSVRTAAFTTKCLAHGRELGQALMSYVDDYNGRYPSEPRNKQPAKLFNSKWYWHPPWMGSDTSHDTWMGTNYYEEVLLKHYVRNEDIWVCPHPTNWVAMMYAYGFRKSWDLNDDMHCWAADPPYPDTPFRRWVVVFKSPKQTAYQAIGRTLNEVFANDRTEFNRYTKPSNKIVASCITLGDKFKFYWMVPGKKLSWIILNPNGAYAHGEGTIYVFADGHAKYMETGGFWAPVRYTNHPWDAPHPRE